MTEQLVMASKQHRQTKMDFLSSDIIVWIVSSAQNKLNVPAQRLSKVCLLNQKGLYKNFDQHWNPVQEKALEATHIADLKATYIYVYVQFIQLCEPCNM